MRFLRSKEGRRQFLRYVFVGVISNGLLYFLYLGMTTLGIGYTVAASVAYAIGVLQTFTLNRSWSFRDRGLVGPALVRYIVSYGAGYIVNIVALVILVDRAGLPHQWVQAINIVCLAVMLFLLQRYWVFRHIEERPL